MIVTIWRHGEAGLAVTDEARELTAGGADDVSYGSHRINNHCQDSGLATPGVILHSPLVRTLQTAEIIDAAFSHATMAESVELAPGGNLDGVDALVNGVLESEPNTRHLVLVSHQPLVTYLVNHWLGDGGAVPSLPPGGLVSVEMDVAGRDCARLKFWSLPPQYEAQQ